jgi:hypothetical protein
VPQRRTVGRPWGWGLFMAALGLVLGTPTGALVGDRAPFLARSLAPGPLSLGLGALRLTLDVHTNLVGLIGAALGALVALARR